MSRGLSRLQRGIVDLLSGKRKSRLYSIGAGTGLDTPELTEEVFEAGLLADDTPSKQALATVRRACGSLVARGLLRGERVYGERGHTIAWRVVRDGEKANHAQ